MDCFGCIALGCMAALSCRGRDPGHRPDHRQGRICPGTRSLSGRRFRSGLPGCSSSRVRRRTFHGDQNPGWDGAGLDSRTHIWALLVGTCLIAAALSIAAKKYAWLASALAGIMIFLFVLLIHVPGIAANPRSQLLWVVGFRDSAFAGARLPRIILQRRMGTPDEALACNTGAIFRCHSCRVSRCGANSPSGTCARSPLVKLRPRGSRHTRFGVTGSAQFG